MQISPLPVGTVGTIKASSNCFDLPGGTMVRQSANADVVRTVLAQTDDTNWYAVVLGDPDKVYFLHAASVSDLRQSAPKSVDDAALGAAVRVLMDALIARVFAEIQP